MVHCKKNCIFGFGKDWGTLWYSFFQMEPKGTSELALNISILVPKVAYDLPKFKIMHWDHIAYVHYKICQKISVESNQQIYQVQLMWQFLFLKNPIILKAISWNFWINILEIGLYCTKCTKIFTYPILPDWSQNYVPLKKKVALCSKRVKLLFLLMMSIGKKKEMMTKNHQKLNLKLGHMNRRIPTMFRNV